MARSLTERAQAAVESLHHVHVPVRLIDRVFASFAGLAAAWLAFLLIYQMTTAGWSYLWAFIPFWLVVTYLLLPRIHSALSKIYLPDYFIGRTRTREGVLGDPVNLALQGDADQIHAAMLRAGWRRADELNLTSAWGIVVATLSRRSYAEAPVSSLFLFGRRQSFTYQQEVEGNPAKRHHVRFWPTPKGWLLPGGRRVDWLAAGTFDRAVGLSLFTLQVTHRIDADVDAERDHILATLTAPSAQNFGIAVERLLNFSTGYHHRNGGGDTIRTDGDLPIVDLRPLGPPGPQVRAKIDEDDAEAAYRRPVPITVAFGVGMMLLRVVVGIVTLLLPVTERGSDLLQGGAVQALLAGGMTLDDIIGVVRVALVIYLVPYLLLAIQVYRRRQWARTCALLLNSFGVLVWALLWFGDVTRTLSLINLVGTALEILVILALSSDTARIFAASPRAPSDPVEAATREDEVRG